MRTKVGHAPAPSLSHHVATLAIAPVDASCPARCIAHALWTIHEALIESSWDQASFPLD